MLIDCLLHPFLGSIQEKSPCSTLEACRQRAATTGCRRASLPVGYLAYYVTVAGLTIFVKRCCTISRTSFKSSAPTPRGFMIFSKSARESHTLPATLLRQNSTGLASDFRLRSAFDVISMDPLSSDISLPLSAWNFARFSFSSIHSANTGGDRSNFLTLALHLGRWYFEAFPIN